MRTIEYKISEPEGLHALLATALISKLNQYTSQALATFGDNTVNAKSPFGLMSLGAHYGDVIRFTIIGDDEDQVELL